MRGIFRVAASRLMHWRGAGERNAAVVGNVLGQLPGSGEDGSIVIGAAEKRHHGAPRIARTRVIDYRLEAIADFDAIFVFVGREQQQHTAIVLLSTTPNCLYKSTAYSSMLRPSRD